MAMIRLLFVLIFCVCGVQAQLSASNPFYTAAILKPQGPPVIGFSQLLTNTSSANATEYTTTSFTTTANALVLAYVVTSDTVLPDAHALTSLHGTWVEIARTNFNTTGTPLNRVSLWRTMSGSGGSSTLTNKFAGAATGCAFNVVQFTGVDTSGSQGSGAIAQVVMGAADATANPAITLAALTGSANAVFAGFSSDVNPFAGTAEASWTEQFDSGYNTPATSIYGVYRLATTDNTVVVTAGSADWGGIACEIKIAP
jgi:hypothetical protein